MDKHEESGNGTCKRSREIKISWKCDWQDNYAYEPMLWVIINGSDYRTLDSRGYAQRAHAVQMLMKFMKNIK